MVGASRYEKNVKRWSFFCPDEAKLLSLVEFFHVSRCDNSDGTPNLKAIYNQTFFLHSTSDVGLEGQDWFNNLNLRNIDILYVYGLGLGYYYNSAKNWLKESKKRFLIFLEDDLEVLRIFFETELAEEMLNDVQVRIYYLDWNRRDYCLEKIVSNYVFEKYKVTALNSYILNKSFFHEIESLIAHFSFLRSGLLAEYISSGINFFNNFYRNLTRIPFSFLGNRLFDQFKNIPAIICGAGPSLEKNAKILHKLKDRALIFAGGTAMNAINAQGIIPHFGVGIDPNIYQFSRLIANQAFEVPYFYRNRMCHEAFRMLHGDRLYITGSGGYFISQWAEQQLEIPTGKVLSEGYNVINFSLSIAHALGCNPIMFVGVDLGYSQNRSYAPGIFYHAIHDPKQDFITKSTREELILKEDILGNPIYTLWKWVNEALWFSQTAKEHPQHTFFNCTEGGIGFPGISNLTLEEASEKYLTRQYDLDGMVHCAIQNSYMPSVITTEKVLDLIKELFEGLKQCHQAFKDIEQEYIEMQQKVLDGQEPPEKYLNEKISQALFQLTLNPGYFAILKIFEWNYIEYTGPRFRDIDYEAPLISPMDVHLKKIALFIERYRFLVRTAKFNIDSIEKILDREDDAVNFSEEEENAPHFPHASNIHEPSDQIYQYAQGKLTIHDPRLGLNFDALLPNIQCQSSAYPSGEKMMECFYEGDKLYGPSIFYYPNGTVSAKSWFIDGKKQGKSWFYYPDGALFSRQCFKDGEREGLQEYFYSDGTPKSIINFSQGVLNGDVFLFHPNGKMMREIHFVNGHRHGEEKLWNEQGILLIEAEYEMDKPVRTAREWYENGNLAKEIIYGLDSQRSVLRRWDEGGMPWKPELLVHEDFFDKVTNQSMLLTQAIGNIVEQLKEFAFSLPHKKGEEGEADRLKEYLHTMEMKIKNLHTMGLELKFESGSDPQNPKEAIWKSESMRHEIQQQLELMTNQMTNEIKSIQDMLSQTRKALGVSQHTTPSKDQDVKSNTP